MLSAEKLKKKTLKKACRVATLFYRGDFRSFGENVQPYF